MKKIISLIKIDLNNTYGLSSLAYGLKKKKDRWLLIIFTIAMLSLIPTYILLLKSLGNLYIAYETLGQSSYFLQIGIFVSQMLIFVLGILYVMSKYYFSNDLEILVPLPIKASQILGSKFAAIMVSEYLTTLPIILPFIIIYGRARGEGLIYWIYSMVLIMALPVIPLIISSILVMVFMKYTNIKGKKDTIRVITSTIFIVIMLYFQIKMQGIIQRSVLSEGDFFLKLAQDSDFLVKRLGMIFPPSVWGALALGNYINLKGLTYLSLFLLVSVVGYGIMINLSEKLFFDGLIGNMDISTSKSRSKRNFELGDSARPTKPYIAIAKKELVVLFKTPVYLINSIGGVIMVPIIIIASSLSSEESIDPLIDIIKNFPQLLVLGAVFMITALGIMNSVGSTTFSREGKNLWIQRVLPISAHDQIIGRLLSSLFVQAIGMITVIGSIIFLSRVDLGLIIMIILLGFLGSVPTSLIGMVIDILRPLLTWDNPQRAMKQNLNVLISMGVGMLYIGALGYLMFKIFYKVDIEYIYLLLAGIFMATSIILYLILVKLVKKQFAELE